MHQVLVVFFLLDGAVLQSLTKMLSLSFYTIVLCAFNPPPRARIGVGVMRDSCRRWSKMNRIKLRLSLSKRVSVLPNWMLRASPRKSLTWTLRNNTMKNMVGTSDLLSPGRFHLGVSLGRLDCLEVIVAHGADLTVTDGVGRSHQSHPAIRCYWLLINMCFLFWLLTDSRPQRPSPCSQKQPVRMFKKTPTSKVHQ